MVWLLGLGLVLLFWLTPAPAHLSLSLAPQASAIYAEKTWTGEMGTLSLRLGLASGGPEASLTYRPREEPGVPITWTCDSLSCVLVRPGQEVREGELIGYVSVAARRRAEQLAELLPTVHDELLAAEVRAELERLARENEVHALVPGRVRTVEVEQVGNSLRVRVVLSCRPL